MCGGSKIVSVQILRSNLSLTESVWLRLLLRFARTRADIEVMLVEIWGAFVPRVAAPRTPQPARARPPPCKRQPAFARNPVWEGTGTTMLKKEWLRPAPTPPHSPPHPFYHLNFYKPNGVDGPAFLIVPFLSYNARLAAVPPRYRPAMCFSNVPFLSYIARPASVPPRYRLLRRPIFIVQRASCLGTAFRDVPFVSYDARPASVPPSERRPFVGSSHSACRSLWTLEAVALASEC